MIKKLTVIEGLGGTGKTHKIKAMIREMKGKEVTYLCFNRKLKDRMKGELAGRNVRVSTIHSLCFKELKAVGRLPEAFMEVESFDTDDRQNSKEFNELLDSFILTFSDGNQLSTIGTKPVLIVDEYQNLDSKLLEVVKAITVITDCELILSGDRYQSLFDYQVHHEGKLNFGRIEQEFNHGVDNRIVLTENRRTRNSILTFINGYLENNLSVEKGMEYDVGTIGINEDKPLLSYFTTKNDEASYVKSMVNQYRGKKSIVILSRFKRDLIQYTNLEDRKNGITVSTIHSFIGNEADIVFIVGYQNADSEAEAKVFYVGILRAKERLFISTSYPKGDNGNCLGKDTYTVDGRQEAIYKPYVKLKTIREDSNLTVQKYQKSRIDSISIKVAYSNAPFLPYIERKIGTRSSFFKEMFIQEEPVKIKVGFHTSYKGYYFYMTDTNLLRRSGYDDAGIIRYLANAVAKFFDNRITREQMEVNSIDIALLFRKDDKELLDLLERFETCQFKRGLKVDGTDRSIMDEVYSRHTVYVELNRNKSAKVAIYRPIDKENGNRFNNRDYVKVELRMRRDALKRGYGKGMENLETILCALKREDHPKVYFTKVIGYFVKREQKRVGIIVGGEK